MSPGETFLQPMRAAAVVFDDQVSVDALLVHFAERLRQGGVRVAGLIQLAPSEFPWASERPHELLDIATRERIAVCRPDSAALEGCLPDQAALRSASERLRPGNVEDADLVFGSCFGIAEIRGQGFGAALIDLLESDYAVLTAVHRRHVHNWFDFTGGIGTVLEARLWVLEHWWFDLTRAQRATQGAPRIPLVLSASVPARFERPSSE